MLALPNSSRSAECHSPLRLREPEEMHSVSAAKYYQGDPNEDFPSRSVRSYIKRRSYFIFVVTTVTRLADLSTGVAPQFGIRVTLKKAIA